MVQNNVPVFISLLLIYILKVYKALFQYMFIFLSTCHNN
jgi:hypothetical protein